MMVRSKAPLRLGLAGGGTDVSPYSDQYGGYVLNATIDMYAYCTIEITDDGKISMFAADKHEYFEAGSSEEFPLNGSLDLHKATYNRLVRDFIRRPLSFRMTTYSDAPVGSGLGASSTMVVAIIKAFIEWLNIPLGEYDIAHLAYEIERIDVGLSGGRQDQYAATFGGINFMEFYADDRVIVNPLRVKNWILNELESSLVLFYTGVSRQSAYIIDEQVRNAETGNKQSVEAMHDLKYDAVYMKEALLKGNISMFAEYLARSWSAKKRMATAIASIAINSTYDVAIEAGALAGKVSGAGGGGFMMFLAEPRRKLDLVRALQGCDGAVVNAHFTKSGTQSWTI